jgi:DHA1 family bicyclomycin/chloramphenicol resistance-like MFS transporter
MFVNSVAYIGGTFVCRNWIARFGVRRSVALAGVTVHSAAVR